MSVVGIQHQSQTVGERQPDNSVLQVKKQTSRIVARDENNNVLNFVVDYAEGKKYELDQVLGASVQ